MDSKIFGKFIAGIRKEKNLTQAELAERIGVTDKAISRWERGIGFPDINILEPLADALGISLLELMRSEKTDMKNENGSLSESEAVEIMINAVEIVQENRKQDKISVYLGVAITLAVAFLVKLSGHANAGGALLIGAIAAIAMVAVYYFIRNRADKESRKIYGLFALAGTGISIWLLHLAGTDSYALVWGVYGIFCIVVFMVGR